MPRSMSDADMNTMFDDIGKAKEELARGIAEEQRKKAEEARRHRPFGGGPVFDDDVDLDAMEREIDAELAAARKGIPAGGEEIPDLGLELDLTAPAMQTPIEEQGKAPEEEEESPQELNLILNLDSEPSQATPHLVELEEPVFDLTSKEAKAKAPKEEIIPEERPAETNAEPKPLPEINYTLDLIPELNLVLDLTTPKVEEPEKQEPEVEIQPETLEVIPEEESADEKPAEEEPEPEKPELEVVAVEESSLDVYLCLYSGGRQNRYSFAFGTAAKNGEKRFRAESIGCDSWQEAAYIASNAILKKIEGYGAGSIVIHTNPDIVELLWQTVSKSSAGEDSKACKDFTAKVKGLAETKSLRVSSHIPDPDIWKTVMYMAKASVVRE